MFTRKKDSSLKQEDPRDMLKKATRSDCTLTALLSPGPFSSLSLNSLAMKRPEDIEEDPDNPGPATEVDIRLEFSSD
jgi:hypothetical protein